MITSQPDYRLHVAVISVAWLVVGLLYAASTSWRLTLEAYADFYKARFNAWLSRLRASRAAHMTRAELAWVHSQYKTAMTQIAEERRAIER